MATESNIELFSEAYLRKYAAGELSNAEMHQLETIALDDPFLADAIDGYMAAASPKSSTQAISNVPNNQQKAGSLFDKSKLTNVFKIKSWKSITAAAGILFFVGIVSYLVFSGNDNKSKDTTNAEVAKNETTTGTDNKIVADSTFTNQLKDEAAKDIVAKEDIKKALEKPLIRPNDLRLVQPVLPVTSAPIGASNDYSPSVNNTTTPASLETDNASKPDVSSAKPTAPATTTQDDKIGLEAEDREGVTKEQKTAIDKREDESLRRKAAEAPPATQPNVARNAAPIENNNMQQRNQNILSTNQAAGNMTKRYGDRYRNSTVGNNNAFSNNFNVSIVNQANEQLGFANINLVKQGLLTYANNQGYFNYKSLDSVVTLNITANGYKTQRITLLPSNNNKIVLEPLGTIQSLGEAEPEFDNNKAKADESSNAMFKKRISEKISQIYVLPSSNITNDVYPVDSWSLYETYLNNNTVYNRVSNNIKTPGLLILTFTVDKEGYPSDITVTKSLEKLQDEDAIRLLRSGPKWKVTGSNRTRQLSIVFR
jgi:hypothetical protein